MASPVLDSARGPQEATQAALSATQAALSATRATIDFTNRRLNRLETENAWHASIRAAARLGAALEKRLVALVVAPTGPWVGTTTFKECAHFLSDWELSNDGKPPIGFARLVASHAARRSALAGFLDRPKAAQAAVLERLTAVTDLQPHVQHNLRLFKELGYPWPPRGEPDPSWDDTLVFLRLHDRAEHADALVEVNALLTTLNAE